MKRCFLCALLAAVVPATVIAQSSPTVRATIWGARSKARGQTVSHPEAEQLLREMARRFREKNKHFEVNCSVTLTYDEIEGIFSGQAPEGSEPDQLYLVKSNTPLVLTPTVKPSGQFTFTVTATTRLAAKDKVMAVLLLDVNKFIESPEVEYTPKAAKPPAKSSLSSLADKSNIVRGGVAGSGSNVEIVVRNKDLVFKDRVFAVVGSDGTFAAALRPGVTLACNDKVELVGLGEGTVKCPPAEPPTVINPVEGDRHLRILAEGAKHVEVMVSQGPTPMFRKKVETSAAEDMSLDPYRLNAGDTLSVTALNDAGVPLSNKTIEVPSSELDWGRVRGYFTGGWEISRDNKNVDGKIQQKFDNNTAIGMSLDYNWLRASRLRVHTFFGARLGSVGVARPAKDMPLADDLSAKVESLNSAVLQTGVYVPFVLANWRYKGTRQSLFIAPMTKSGLYAPAGDTPDRVFTFYSGGVRFGHFMEPERRIPCEAGPTLDRDRAAELLSHLDITFGRFSNLQASAPVLAPAGDTSGNPRAGDPEQVRLPRALIEGFMKIPKTPFIIGFNANIAMTTRKGYWNPRDDFRILLGARFDIAKMLGSLIAFQTR